MPLRDNIRSLFERAVSWTGLVPPPPHIQDAVRAPLNGHANYDEDDPEDVAARLLGERTRRQDGTASLQTLIAHHDQFSTRWGGGTGVYWSRFDEALRDNWINALAMRRSSFIEELMSARKYPVTGMDWHIECDNPKEDDQKRVVEQVTKCVDSIPYFTAMRYYLGEDKWQGKYGSQVKWSDMVIDGKPMIGIVAHEPVDGDSIVYGYDKVPGILVRTGWSPAREEDRSFLFQPKTEWIKSSDRARALFLHDQFWRDHFVISNFNPRSADYLYEGDKAAAIFGLGYRGMLYWDFQLREELRSWLIDALQRIGVNGMLYGFFESGNVRMMNEVILALKMLIRDNVTAFPFLKGQLPAKIEHIEPSSVGYDVLAHWIDILEQTMRRCVLGQSLSSMVGATGMGSEVARLHEQTIQHVIRSDAQAQQEVITRDILGPMIRFNTWEYKGQKFKGKLPFNIRFVYNFEKADAVERAQIINSAYQMGLPMSIEQIQADIGISPPKSPEDTIQSPQYLTMMAQLQQMQQQQMMQEMQMAQGVSQQGAPGGLQYTQVAPQGAAQQASGAAQQASGAAQQASGVPQGAQATPQGAQGSPVQAAPEGGPVAAGSIPPEAIQQSPSSSGGAPGLMPEQGPSTPVSDYVRDMAIGAANRGVVPGMIHHVMVQRGPDGKLVLRKVPIITKMTPPPQQLFEI